MNIQIGKDTVSLLNPPGDGLVQCDGQSWKIGRNGSGLIVLRKEFASWDCHPDFINGMSLLQFCEWINGQLV